jgi:hypothetical protein
MSEEKTHSNLLPLVPTAHKYEDARKASFNLLTEPGTATSVKYKFEMFQIDGSEPLREILTFRTNVKKLAHGMAMDSDAKSAPLIVIIQRMLHGTAIAAFNEGVNMHLKQLLDEARTAAYDHEISGSVDPDNPTDVEIAAAVQVRLAVAQPVASLVTVEIALDEMIRTLAPFRALARVKRYLRRSCRKPADMPIRAYVSHFMRINNEELELLPPFTVANKLDCSEMAEIWQYAIPASWNKKLQEQGKDPVLMSASQFITATEYIESAETDFDKDPKKDKSSKKKDDKKSSGGTKYCKVHGQNKTHDTANCKVIKGQGSGAKSYEKKPFSKNKTWNRDSNKSSYKSKNDLAAFIAKTVKAEINSYGKKKSKKDLNAIDKDEEGEVKDDVSLKDFDYDQLDNLSFTGDNDDASMRSVDYDTAEEN